jgi:hypothetical protein
MLTPLLERRTQRFQIDDEIEDEIVTHRRYIPPAQAAELLCESGFERVRWIPGYDPSAAGPLEEGAMPNGPFMLIGET